MSTSLLDMVVHYQRKVERSNDEEKILHCFSKLQKLPITVEVLSQTGVGKTVNAFRRDPGPVGETSRKLVAKWKDIFEENEKRLKRLKAEKEAAVRAERERSRAGERGHDKERHRNRERERSRERSREPSEGRSREQSEERSREHSAERSASPADSEASDGMEVDEARALEEQARADAEAEAEAEAAAEAARQAEAERRAKDEEKRRRREERARREAEKNGVVVKEEHKSHSGRDKHSSSDKHRKESKHRKHDPPLENGHSEPLFAVVKGEKSDHRHNGRAEGEKSHHSSHHHRSKHGSSSGHSSGEKHASPDEQYTPSEKHHSSSEKRSSSEKHSSKDKSRGDEASSSKSHHKSRSNGALEASHSSSSSKKSSHADSETDASREARRSKHKSKRDKHEKISSKSEKKEDKKPVKLREVDFLCQPGGNDSDADQGGSFADALGGSDATPKKKKKKSKSSSSSHTASSSSAASAVPTYIPTRVADLPRPPPPPPPAVEVLDALPEISATYRPLPRPAAAPARPAAKRALDEDEALKAVLAGKNKRTKVYSGARSTGLSRVPTLLDICLRCLTENIDNVEQTGGVPYEILRTVLEKCTANQLSTIEYYNPYLLEDTDVLWEALVKKEFKCERREEMETWREMYARCSEEREQKYNKLRSMIEGKRKESLASSRKTKVAYEHTVAKPPRNIARKQAKHGTAVAASMPAPTVLAGGGSRPPRPAPGTDPTSRPAAPNRAAAPPKKKAPLMAKVLRAMGRR